MSFLTPWVSELGAWACRSSVALLPARAGAAVCAIDPWQLGMTIVALCGGLLGWYESRRRLKRHG